MKLKRLLLYFNTVKHLRRKQLLFNFIRRFFSNKVFVEFSDVSCNALKLIPPIKCIDTIDAVSVNFLNKRRSFSQVGDWICKDEPKLWRYNLHYFDYLLDTGASEEVKDRLIDDWIKASHNLDEDAWEPYPVSLRIVNWIKYFIIYKNNSVPESWLQSLSQQAHVLSKSIEYHILANHYLKNGKGLLFAGAFLQVNESDKWFSKGKDILLEAVEEQILEDGGHYEKSPMYHSIVVEDYLDVINLIDSNTLAFDLKSISLLHKKTKLALDFLSNIIMPDGEIPLFNDSAFKIAPHPDLIFEYSGNVLGYERLSKEHELSIKYFDASEYFVIRDGDDMCVIDCGSVSPQYQPGHTHCDILSYELALNGERLIVDTGVYDYEESESRQYCRSTAAHNTVSIDGNEQTELWGAFRVARRSTVCMSSVTKKDNDVIFSGSYIPYWVNTSGIVHHRKIVYNRSGEWLFRDIIEGFGEHLIENFIHFHSDIDLDESEGNYLLKKNGKIIAELSLNASLNHSITKKYVFPEFGVKRESKVLTISVRANLPITTEYVIKSLVDY